MSAINGKHPEQLSIRPEFSVRFPIFLSCFHPLIRPVLTELNSGQRKDTYELSPV